MLGVNVINPVHVLYLTFI